MHPKTFLAPRIEPLAHLPVFFALEGQRVVVAGNNAAAAWKAELAAAAGAHVAVFSPDPSEAIRKAVANTAPGRIECFGRAWRSADLEGAALAIGALDGEDAAAFSKACRLHRVPVNIVDTPHLSTVSFGTIVNRDPMTIAISTGGAAPVLGQAIRAKIEALLHPALGSWVAVARGLREEIGKRVPMGAARRALWQRFAEAALAAGRPPKAGEIEALLANEVDRRGSVALVGAGPGDPELLTLKGLRALQSADVILYDRLVDPAVLELARREAERIDVGKQGHGPHCPQAEINALMVRLAHGGKRVIRLKGGDPLIFGRAAEEIAACQTAGIPVEVIPGVTAALGAAAELLVPLTDRRYAKRLQAVTGHAEQGGIPEHDWPALADPEATTVFYMAGRTFADMLPKLLDAGLDPDCPAVAVAAATTARRAHVQAPVAALAGKLNQLDEREPRLIIVGRSVSNANLPEAPTAFEAAKKGDAAT